MLKTGIMRRIDDIDSDLLETRYVKSLVFGKGQIAVISGIPIYDSIIKSGDTFQILDEFQYRYNEQQIAIRYRYEDYISDKDMQATITGLGMNPDAFWLLIVFCFDYACDCCYNGIQIAKSAKEHISDLIDMILEKVEVSGKKVLLKEDMTLTLKMKGKSMSINSGKAIINIANILQNHMDEIEDSSFFKGKNDKYYEDFEESDSVQIWFFAKLMLYFFELHPEFKGRATKGSGISLNKHVLISNLIYYTGLSRNEKFLNDDETLKGYLRQYKNKDFKNRGSIYN